MFERCRPWGRIFCLVLMVGIAGPGVRLLASEGAAAGSGARASARAALPAAQSGPALTSVVDTVYRADGSAAQGVLVITWPAFVTAAGTAVAAGALNVTLGTNGALNVALASNAGANPPGVYYTVVYQLGPGEVRTEYWVVPTSSPADLAEVRTTPGAGTAAPAASEQYVNTALAGKANDNAVVHLAGTETVTGAKVFSVPPNVPTPVGTSDVTNKAYVDASIATVGAGNYLPTAGGAMTGPLTLSGNPTAPLQAAAKQYVDATAAAKANLVTGLVPTNELGSGTASALNCLLGNGTWGPCGSSANATAIQSVPVVATAPANGQVLTYSSTSGQYAPATPSGGIGGLSVSPVASQNIVQPANTQTGTNNFNAIRYVTVSDNWSSTGFSITGSPATVTLTPCPLGIDTSGLGMYFVYIAQGATTEIQQVTGGTCSSGAASGTIIFNATNTYTSATISSASSGVQEAINDGCGTGAAAANCRIVLPPTGAASNALVIRGTVFEHCSRCLVEGNGTLLYTYTRDRAWMLGSATIGYQNVALKGITFSSAIQVDGCLVTNTAEGSSQATITVASGCSNLKTGDIANISFTDSLSFWGNHGPITVSGTTITYSHTGTIPSEPSPGSIAIQNAAIEDNSLNIGLMENIDTIVAAGGRYNNFFVLNNDQSATIRNFNAASAIECTVNYCGSFVYSGGSTQAAPVIWIDKMNLSPQCAGNGITVYANNSVRISDSVIQGFGMWGINTQTILGSFGGTQLENVYWEEGGGPCVHPYEGSYFSAAGIIFQGGQQLTIAGGEGPAGSHVPQFSNTGTTQYNYFVVANDTTSGGHSFPLLAGFALTNGSGTITGQFPHIPPSVPGDTVTYDILRMQPSNGLAPNAPSFPVTGACIGGSTTACGSIVTGQAQCSGLVCTFTDTASANTANYSLPVAGPNWFPVLPFWPAEILIPGNGGSNFSSPPVISEIEPSDMVSVLGNTSPQIYVRQCNDNSAVDTVFFGGVWEQCLEGKPTIANVGGLLLQDGFQGSTGSGVKGRLNFENLNNGVGYVYPHHIITLVDSKSSKTLATIGFRPPNDATDTYIGIDNQSTPSNSQLAFGSPVAISHYIGNVGDNSSYLERLTAAAKTFNVPVSINGNLTVTGTCTGCGSGAVNSGTATQVALYATNGTAVSGDGGLTDSGSTLNYTGSNGISAAAGTFSGNVTVNGQLLVAGPWSVSSPIPGSAMAPAAAGTSALGISNDGNFYISANAGTPLKVATTATSSYFSNLFQEDANDLGEYNGTTAQNLHVYSSYTNGSTWQRTSLGYDAGDGYAVVRSENSTSGAAPGLGFWINSGLKWVIDASSNFKHWADQTYNIGSFNGASGTGLRPGTVYAAGSPTSNSGFELGKFANESYEICNDATNGTVVNGLAMLTTGGCAAKPASALISGGIGVVIANAGTSGVATVARAGYAYCSFDATATVVGDYVVPSSTANGGFYPLCHDAGGTRPTGTQILGRVMQASSGAATVQMFLDMPGSSVSSSGAAAGTGSCMNQAVTAVLTGGPTCTTITSAYVDGSIATAASAALTGTPTAPTAAASTNTTQVATTAFAHGVAPPDAASTVWITVHHAGASTVFSSSSGKAAFFGVILGFQKTTSQVSYYVSTADTSATTYDLGIYSGTSGGTCTLQAHTGSIAGSTATTSGAHTVSWTGGSATLQPGRYYLALTASATASTAVLYGDSGGVTFAGGTAASSVGNVSIASGGTLPATATCPTDSVQVAAVIPAWLVD